MQESFVFYKSFYEAVKGFSNDTVAEFFKLVCEYAFKGEFVETEDKVAYALFLMTVPQIDASQKRRENGKKGGAPVGNNNAQKTSQKTTKRDKKQPMVELQNNQWIGEKQPNVNVNVNDNLKEKDEQSSSKKEIRDEFFLHRLIDAINQDEHQGWREVMMKNFRIENFHQAMQDYQDWLIATTMENDVHNISDFKRIFNYNAQKFLSEEALHYRAKPVIINGIEYN